MAENQNFDKLNNLRSMPYEKYFGEMGLSDSEKKRRLSLAFDIEDDIAVFMTLFKDGANETLLTNQLNSDLLETISKHTEIDDYLQQYALQTSQNTARTTFNRKKDKWYTSEDRTRYIAENEANTIGNYIQYLEMLNKGLTKTWVAMPDERVRKHHIEVDGTTLPIQGIFEVGSSKMRFPKDTYYDADASEIVNCRCWLEYK